MLTLTLSGNIIPISLDFSMRLTWKNPACDFEKIPAGYGLGLSFPINEHTRALFGNPQRFAKYRSGNDQKFTGFEVRFSGVLLMAGTLSITSAAGGNYEATLIDQVGVLGEAEQERSILEIPRIASGVMAFENKSQYTAEADKYCCFPIKNYNFFKEKGYTVELKRNIPDPENPGKVMPETFDTELLTHLFDRTVTPILGELYGSRVNSTAADGTIIQYNSNILLSDKLNLNDGIPAASKVSVVSPFFFLNYIIKEVLLANDFHIISSFLQTHPALKNLCIYNTYDITYTLFTVGTGFYAWPYFNTQLTKAQGQRIQAYTRSAGSIIETKNHLPKMKVGELLLSIQNLANVCFHFLPNKTVKVYSRDALITGNAIDLDKYFLDNWDIGEKKNVSLNFTRERDDKDLVYSERFHDLGDRKADIKTPVWNWESLQSLTPQLGEIRYLYALGIFAEYKWITVSTAYPDPQNPQTVDVLGWEEASVGAQNGWYNYGREEVEEIKTMWSFPDSPLGSGLTVLQEGNMSGWPKTQQEFSPRLMFKLPGWNDGSSVFVGTGISTENELSMEYEDETKGILTKLWKNWNPFWANRLPVSGSFDLPVNVLRHLIYNICSKFRTREGEFMIEEMSCDIYIDRIGETEIKGYKID